jgi:hypothetical protein
VALEAVDFLLFCDVENSDLALGVADCDFVVVAEGEGADVVVELGGLVESGDFGGAAGPEVKGGVECDCDLVAIGPIEQVEVEIVLEVGGV